MARRSPPARALPAFEPPSELAEAVGEGIWRVTGGAFPSNAYICAAGVPGEAFVVDPGLDPQRIDRAARELGLTPRQVFCTHGHFDHVGGASFFQRTYGAEVFLHQADLKTAKSSNFLLMVVKLEQRITLPELTLVDPAAPPAMPVTYLPVPGHTPGSSFLRFGEHLFTGDSLYARGVGLSDLPGENHGLLRQSLTALWNTIECETMIHPGHGPSATFATIRESNRPLLAFLAGEAGR
ncbi:MAG TPA: MBL fold metallo-hydrolase [Caulobacteraceae bacterium]|jgi:glyoxylase-like metal-dependent hydrolase (beta-lactamase superfamily II)